MDLSLSDEQLKRVVSYVAGTDEGLALIGYLVSTSNAFNKGCNGNSKDTYIKGRADFGLEIVELMELYATEKWFELQQKDIDKRTKGD